MASARRILFVTQTDWFFHLHFLPLARHLVREGWDVKLACLVDRHGIDLDREGIRLLPWTRLRVRSLGLRDQMLATRELAEIIRRVDPDIVQLISPKPITLGSMASLATSTPGVVSLVTGLGFLFTGEGRTLSLIRRASLGAIKAGHRPAAARMVFQNETDRTLFVRSGVIPAGKTAIVPGVGTDLARFQPGSPHNPVPVIVTGARMLRDKGIRELVEAARILQREGIACRVLLCGDPDPGNPSSLSRGDLQRWHDDGIVEWSGHVSAIETILAGADIACLPSYREGLPKFLLDAAACGLPLVATDVPGCREVVRHGDNGQLVPPRNPEALADALARLIQHPDERRRMGQRSLNRARREFSQERSVQRMLEVYRGMLDHLDR